MYNDYIIEQVNPIIPEDLRMAQLADNKVIVLDVPFKLDIQDILTQMHIHGNTKRFEAPLKELVEIVKPVARPKALIKVVCVDHKTPETLQIDGVEFDSKLVREKLGEVETAFICMTTVGVEVEQIPPPQDVLQRYCLDSLKNTLLFYATGYLKNFLQENYKTGTLTNLNPGETESFPIDQQRKLFQIIGDVEGYIGVTLSENCALLPTKSHSGIYFSTDVEFISCRLCTNQRCSGRRAPYEPELAAQYKK